MSVTNAISGITAVGGLLQMGYVQAFQIVGVVLIRTSSENSFDVF